MFKPIPDYANEAYEVVAASYPAGWWTVTAHGIPIRHFGDRGNADCAAKMQEAAVIGGKSGKTHHATVSSAQTYKGSMNRYGGSSNSRRGLVGGADPGTYRP